MSALPGVMVREKRPVVEAFQLTKERRESNMMWPAWLNNAWNLEPEEVGAVFPETPGTSDGPLSVRVSPELIITLGFGDWIIRGVKGELFVVTDKHFKKHYEYVT